MNVEIASSKDYHALYMMFENIVNKMVKNNLTIWRDVNPCDYIMSDIGNQRLYIVKNDYGCLVGAFSLYTKNDASNKLEWNIESDNVFYISRFAIHVDFLNQGMGSIVLDEIKKLASGYNKEAIRLLVVDCNLAAIKLYEKYGFTRVSGEYYQKVRDDLYFKEFGYELMI